MPKANDLYLLKLDPSAESLEYPNHDRATKTYNLWMSGSTEDEISMFFNLPLEEVQKDLMHVSSGLPVRQIIQHNNDRSRILLQRQQSEDFRKLLADALKIEAKSYLVAGVSPAGILKEYREAVGQVSKSEPLVAIQQNFNGPSSAGGGIRSAEDLIRSVLRNMDEDPQLLETTTITAEPEEVREDEDTIQIESQASEHPDEKSGLPRVF